MQTLVQVARASHCREKSVMSAAKKKKGEEKDQAHLEVPAELPDDGAEELIHVDLPRLDEVPLRRNQLSSLCQRLLELFPKELRRELRGKTSSVML